MIFISLVISIAYVILILSLIVGFDRIKVFSLEKVEEKTRFSILVPFRNEAENLPYLLKSFLSLNYSPENFEVLLIDDESEDDSIKIIEEFQKETNFKLVILKNNRISESPKKDAISQGIKYAKNDWILTTDADCIVPKKWLQCYNSFIQKNNVEMVCGAVSYTQDTSFLQRFLKLELFSLMAATIGSFGIRKPFMCNGANLCYSKQLFKALNGFDGNSNIASGDDIFLLEKAIGKDPACVSFLKSAECLVYTKPVSSLESAIAQRIRWASKSMHYKIGFGKLLGLVIFTMNALIVSSFILVLFQVIPLRILLYSLLIKFYCDLWLILKTAIFLDSRKVLASYFLSSFLYPFFSVAIGVKSMFSSYHWKGRQFTK